MTTRRKVLPTTLWSSPMRNSAACGLFFFSASYDLSWHPRRESLIFEVGLKENLLANIETSLELARHQVDPLQVKETLKAKALED